jgi:transcriptional regulator with XRE-family HTH domain
MSVVDRIIKKFGTQQALAEAIGIDQSAVSFWRKSGIIPARRQQQIFAKARELNIALSPADFFDPPEGEPADSRPCDTEAPDPPSPQLLPPAGAEAEEKVA